MRVNVLQENFSTALATAVRFTSTKAQLPVLSNILLSAEKSSMVVSSTNLENSISISVGASVKNEGKITVPAKTISDLVLNLPKGNLLLDVEKEILTIKTESFSSVVTGINASDFPSIPSQIAKNHFNASSEDFISSLSSVLFSVSSDETRPVLTGVLMIFEESGITFVATDGFRLSKKQTKIKTGYSGERMILPKNSLVEFSRLAAGSDTFSFDVDKANNQMVFAVDGKVLSSRVIEGTYPDFEKIIPKSSSVKISVDKEDFLRSVKLASVFARDAANVVKIKVQPKSIKMLAESSQGGSQENEIEAKVDFGGSDSESDLLIAFNFKFLEEIANTLRGESIDIGLTDANSPGVFRDPNDDEYLHLIMPVRLSS